MLEETYWYHGESECVMIALGEAEARENADSGCDEITFEQYLTFKKTGKLYAEGT